MSNKISILSVGYSRPDTDDTNSMRANCSSTLIETSNGVNVVVDTMTSWDGELLQQNLKKHNLEPKDIHYVVCSHGHSDHIGCNYLFTNAIWHFVGTCVSKRDRYLDWNFNEHFQLDGNNVFVLHTPGHTMSCVSVVVNDTNLGETVGVCGDLFERKEDILDERIWLEAGSEDPKRQMANRVKMLEMCSYIIPGHGHGFEVTQEMAAKLKTQMV
ncbi:metallo-beta-lactamase domain-containing protein 1 [Glossina fuscipes]|uniref:Metallo-beta-lactamase domain-containing protein 1 n=1 Tax=Glossina fuscipes TaxID=7396 RepID=A0A9C5ZKG4_9MUSC|nr:metallo-beta-lactamase domain-containing protein 1 [Glossina fuscipes]XP_037897959.1 metallo-beta-lactamase domain-containing protein 1 [Glossina fuscipes]